jgi:hypothetical protein
LRHYLEGAILDHGFLILRQRRHLRGSETRPHNRGVQCGALMIRTNSWRRQARPPRDVFASSAAVFGGELPLLLDDSTAPNPQTSYGTQKVCWEYLSSDYNRKRFIDGRSMRLPTVSVRAGKPQPGGLVPRDQCL